MTGSPVPPSPEISSALADAAQQALHAPSVFNSQPWRWWVSHHTLELFADRDRQLTVTDPDARLLMVSCGTALHHACVALRAAGFRIEVTRFPTAAEPDLLAAIQILGRQDPPPAEVRLRDAIPQRRTDRRAFGTQHVPAEVLTRLHTAVEENGAHLHIVPVDQVPTLAVATAQAAASELADPAYRNELIRWTNRPPWSGDGVPATTAVRQGPRRVPVRDYTLSDRSGLEIGTGQDQGATYCVLFGPTDEPASWLPAGEALSALLLTAVVHGVSAAPLSDAIEQAWPRALMRELLAGAGEPYLALRLGIGADPSELPSVPRRDPDEVIGFSG
jgi:hypothetical protein